MPFPTNPADLDEYVSANGATYQYLLATNSWQQIVNISTDFVLTDPTVVPETSNKVVNMVSITQADYDLLAPPDAATLYIIVG